MSLISVSKSNYQAEVVKKEKMEQELNNMMKIQEHSYSLPDRGEKLKTRIAELLKKIDKQNSFIQKLKVDDSMSVKNEIAKSFEHSLEVVETVQNEQNVSDEVVELPNDYIMKVADVKPKHFGKVGMKNFETKKALTVEKLQEVHDELDQRPNEDELDEAPKYLKVELMKHQLHALNFMRWREQKSMKGGIIVSKTRK